MEMKVCLLGDDRERPYEITYSGTADFPRWDYEDPTKGCIGEVPVRLVRINGPDDELREALVANHPDYGWCSVGVETCRAFDPPIDEDRLRRAA